MLGPRCRCRIYPTLQAGGTQCSSLRRQLLPSCAGPSGHLLHRHTGGCTSLHKAACQAFCCIIVSARIAALRLSRGDTCWCSLQMHGRASSGPCCMLATRGVAISVQVAPCDAWLTGLVWRCRSSFGTSAMTSQNCLPQSRCKSELCSLQVSVRKHHGCLLLGVQRAPLLFGTSGSMQLCRRDSAGKLQLHALPRKRPLQHHRQRDVHGCVVSSVTTIVTLV